MATSFWGYVCSTPTWKCQVALVKNRKETRHLPVIHVQEEGGGRLVELVAREQPLELLHQVVFVRRAHTAKLLQQILIQVVVHVHDFASQSIHKSINNWLNSHWNFTLLSVTETVIVTVFQSLIAMRFLTTNFKCHSQPRLGFKDELRLVSVTFCVHRNHEYM